MERDGSGVSALLGLDGFVVRAQLLDEASGEWWLAVETTEDRAWCAACGVRAVGHGRRRVKVRDLPMADRPVVLVWAKRLWRCPEPACAAGTWSEESDEIAPRAVLTERARAEIARRVGPGEQSVARAARDFGVALARGDGRGVGSRPAPGRSPGPPRAPRRRSGWTRPRSWPPPRTHPTLLVTGILDLGHRPPRRRSACSQRPAVTDWLASKPAPWLAGIRHVVIDPYQPYATAVAAELPDARLVVDHFHVIRLANAALDEVRRRVQQTTTGSPGPQGRPALPDPPPAPGRPRTPRPRPASPGCWPGSTPATPTARSAPPTWPRSCCARPTSPTTSSTPAGASPCFYDHCHGQRRARARTARPHHRPLGDPDPALAPHPAHQRRHRRHQPGRSRTSSGSASGSGTSTTIDSGSCCAAAPHGNSPGRINTTPPPTHHRVEPPFQRLEIESICEPNQETIRRPRSSSTGPAFAARKCPILRPGHLNPGSGGQRPPAAGIACGAPGPLPDPRERESGHVKRWS